MGKKQLGGLVLLGAVALAGCDGASKASPSATTSEAPPSVTSLGAKVCSDFTQSTSTEVFVREEGTCDAEGITVYTFNSDSARDQWMKIAQSFGGVNKEGHLWVVSGSDASAVDAAVAKLGH